jgi:hypothetical protein
MWRIPQLRWGISLRRRLTLLVGLGLAADSDCLLTRDAKQLDRSGSPERLCAFEVSGSQPVLMARHAESEPNPDTMRGRVDNKSTLWYCPRRLACKSSQSVGLRSGAGLLQGGRTGRNSVPDSIIPSECWMLP